jgi:hypothetical protein
MKVLLAVLITAGIAAGSSSAATTLTLIAHNGDRIEAPLEFCFVKKSVITCRPRDRLDISAKVSDTWVKLLVRGVPVYVCPVDGSCYKP